MAGWALTRRGLVACILVWGIALAKGEAQPSRDLPRLPSRASIDVLPCASGVLDVDALLRIVRVELRSDGVVLVDDADAGVESHAHLSVDVDCARGDGATLRITDAASSHVESLDMDLRDVATAAKPRALALALVELLRARWPAIASPRQARPSSQASPNTNTSPPSGTQTAARDRASRAVEPAPAPDAPARDDAPPTTRTRDPSRRGFFARPLALKLGGHAKLYLPDGTLLWGGEAFVELGPFGVGATVAANAVNDALGAVGVGMAGGVLRFAPLALTTKRLELRAALRLTLGAAWARAEANTNLAAGASTSTFYIDGAIELLGSVRVVPPLGLSVSLHAGRAEGLEPYADNRRIASVAGWFLGATVGVLYFPDQSTRRARI